MMKKYLLFVCLFMAATRMTIVAEKIKPTCAVLTFDPRGGVSVDEVSLLSDRFSIELNNLGKYTLISRGKMKEILMIQEFSREDHCSVSECAVEAGQILGVQYMIYGSLGKIGSLYTMNTYLVNVETSATEKAATSDHRGGIEAMLTEVMAMNVRKLLRITDTDREGLTPSVTIRSGDGVWNQQKKRVKEEERKSSSSYFEFTLTPRGTALHIDGRRIDTSRLEVQPGKQYKIMAKKRGYISHEEEITSAESGQTKRIKIRLRHPNDPL